MQERTGTEGMRIQRRFTTKGADPLGNIDYETRKSFIRNTNGQVMFEIDKVEVPKDWSQVATDVLAQKYFRKTGVPQYDESGEPILDDDGNPVAGTETSIKEVAIRLAGCWRHWGETHGYFASEDDAEAFEDELKYMIVNQIAAPNSPQWFNTGLAWKYGIKGQAQGHWYVDPRTGEAMLSEDAYTRPQPHACFIQSIRDDLVNPGGIFDLVTREARIFKYGSGTGTNFSTLRAVGEPLSGGGKSSGLMSFLGIFDKAAGSIKSGGTTRRAAKMVCLDLDHPEIETFIDWKMKEEQKVADLVAGSKNLNEGVTRIFRAVEKTGDTDLETNRELRQAVRHALSLNIPSNYVARAIQLAGMGITDLDLPIFDTHFEGEAYNTISGQNSNNSIRIPNGFFKALETGGEWNLINRTDGKVAKTLSATGLWKRICFAAWSCADPGVQFDTTINEWHTCPEDGRINGSNPCSEYMFLDDTACNLASINLAKFLKGEKTFDIDGFKHACRLWTVVLEISVLMAQFPSKRIAELSYRFRTLGLGYANLGTVLMRMGIPYDSDESRTIAGCLTAVMCGEAYATSAEMAGHLGPFPGYERNREHMLRVIRNHRRAAYNASEDEYEDLTVTPTGIDPTHVSEKLVLASRECWDRALEFGERFGYRNAQVTVIAPTGTIGLVMDCDTTGVEPDFALVKYKKLAGGGYMKIVNQSVPQALATLGYDEAQRDEIITYITGMGTLKGAPGINHETLKEKGFTDESILAVEDQIGTAMDLSFAFNSYTLGNDLLEKIGIRDPAEDADILQEMGFTPDQIEAATEYACGRMTIEGAPHLKDEHLPVFDCANKCGRHGTRYIPYEAHIKMMAAVQPFISGAISKTINMPKEAVVDDISKAYRMSWSLMLKANALYRDGSKMSQALNATSSDLDAELLHIQQEDDIDETVTPEAIQVALAAQALPARRSGFVQESVIGGHKVMVKTSEYPDGRLADVQVDMYKEGSSYRCLVNAFAAAVSKGLQHGVPLEEYVDDFTFTKFDPAGVVIGDPRIRQASSPIDYVFRLLGSEYLGRDDLVHVKEESDRKKSHQTILARTDGKAVSQAKEQGFTGEECHNCGSMKVKQNGTCSLCLDCGTTSGCS